MMLSKRVKCHWLRKGNVFMQAHTSKFMQIALLVLALCFSAVFLFFPAGLKLVDTNRVYVPSHTYECCNVGYNNDINTNISVKICCVICVNHSNEKILMMVCITSNSGVFSVVMLLLALHSILGLMFLYAGPISPISLKVRMNN